MPKPKDRMVTIRVDDATRERWRAAALEHARGRDPDISPDEVSLSGWLRHLASEHDAEVFERLEMIADLRRAITDGSGLDLVYSPIVDLAEGRPTAVEVLPSSPLFGLRRGQTAALAAENGLVVEFTLLQLELGLRQCVAWHAVGTRVDLVMRVTVVELQAPGLVERMDHLLRSRQLPDMTLTFELDETEVFEVSKQLIDVVDELRALGIGLVISAFGRGATSIAVLSELSPAGIEIAPQIVAAVVDDTRSRRTVEAIVSLTTHLSIGVQAAGVDDLLTLDTLLACGVTRCQGSAFSVPLAAPRLTPWLERWRFVPTPDEAVLLDQLPMVTAASVRRPAAP